MTGDSLLVRIRIAFGASIAADPDTWTWTDVTQWWHVPDDVTITWGREPGAEKPETSRMTLTLKNTDGRFTSGHPMSPYWPHVRKWTPISFDVDLGDGVGWRNRFSGYVRKWPLDWPGKSSRMALARIEAVGVIGRLNRGKPPARSPLRRTIAASAVAYWPAEDGDAATLAGSAIPGHPALTVTGGGSLAFAPATDILTGEESNFGTGRLADLSGGAQLSAPVPASVTAATAGVDGWSAGVTAQLNDTAVITGDVVLIEVDTPGGTYVKWRLVAATGSGSLSFGLQIVAYTASGTPTVITGPFGVPTSFGWLDMSVWPDGGNIAVGMRWLGSGWEDTAVVPGSSAGATRVAVNTFGATSTAPLPIGHISLFAGHPAPPAIDTSSLDEYESPGFHGAAINAYEWETAHERLARLCAEDRLELTMPVVASDGAVSRMGPQPIATPTTLHQECETADLGLLYEAGFGLGYLPRDARYNPPVALTIDAAAGELGMPFQPVDDDQMLRNRWTVERINGASETAADDELIDLQGEIEGTTRANLGFDSVLPNHASWHLHQATVQEPRYPSVPINLSSRRRLAAAWCDCRPGSRVQVVNPPEQNAPGTVDQLLVGATETYHGRRSWRADLNVVPASPWMVAEADGDQRVAADGSTLAAGIDADDLTLSLASTAENGTWSTDPADYPQDLRIGGDHGVGGERVTATGISGDTSPQTVTLSARGVNGVTRAWPAGTSVDVWDPAIVPL